MPRSKSRAIAYAVLLISTAIWGFAVPIIKYTFQFTTPNQFLFYRYIFASIFFIPIFLIYRSRKKHKINHLNTFLLAILGTPLYLAPFFYGLQLTSSVEASILGSSSTVFTILMGVVFLREKLSSNEKKGLLIALLGAFFIAFEPLFSNQASPSLSIKGNLLIILSTVIGTIFLLITKKIKSNPVYLSLYSYLVSIPFFYLLMKFEGLPFSLNANALPGILFMAIAGSIIAFWAYQEGQNRIEASEAAVFSYLRPAFAIPLSLLWLKESFSPLAITATIIIIYGVYISEKQ